MSTNLNLTELSFQEMEGLNGGANACVNVAAAYLGMIASAFTTPIGVGLLGFAASSAIFIDNLADCEKQAFG